MREIQGKSRLSRAGLDVLPAGGPAASLPRKGRIPWRIAGLLYRNAWNGCGEDFFGSVYGKSTDRPRWSSEAVLVGGFFFVCFHAELVHLAIEVRAVHTQVFRRLA